MGNGKIAQLWAGRLHNAMTRRNLDMIPYPMPIHARRWAFWA